jgi:hypothetical protein
MALFIMQFSPASHHFIPLRCKYLPKHPVFKHPQSVFFLNVRDQFPHPHKTTGKIIVFYVLNFTLLDSRREDKDSELRGGKLVFMERYLTRIGNTMRLAVSHTVPARSREVTVAFHFIGERAVDDMPRCNAVWTCR